MTSGLRVLRRVLVAASVAGLVAGFSATEAVAASSPKGTLTAFKTDAELKAYLKRLFAEQRSRGGNVMADMAVPAPPPAPTASAPSIAQPMAAAKSSAEAVVVTGSARSDDTAGITNTQVQGVDEGDIVKRRGDLLIVLHRGRLFTISIAGGKMKAVDVANAYPPDVDASNDWYDEMLVAGDRVIVIGYSYGRGGTEINRFHLDTAGNLSHEDAYEFRSNDYYSSRNYASRLIGNKLILYAPIEIYDWRRDDPFSAFPGIRRWTGKAEAPFKRVGSARQVYYTPLLRDVPVTTVHSITSCDVTTRVINCNATSLLGPDGSTFYVSGRAVYVWTSPAWGNPRSKSILYRLPLDGSAPSAIGVRGAPTDQFSFQEDADVLNVLVRSDSEGDRMWSAEFSEGKVALLRVPLSRFGDGANSATRKQYRMLPTPKSTAYGTFQNRFAGSYVLYGLGESWGTPKDRGSILTVVPLDGGAVTELPLIHGVDRLDLMGRDAIAIGSSDKNLYFSAVVLAPGAKPKLGDRYVMEGASQSETRSHGFFFKPEAGPNGAVDGDYGVLGLPVAHPATPGFTQLFQDSAGMVFVRRSAGQFRPLGELDSHAEGAVDDKCVASCVDWYGNARPIFMSGRTFALMGYELVEGDVGEKAIKEAGRINFAPKRKERAGE